MHRCRAAALVAAGLLTFASPLSIAQAPPAATRDVGSPDEQFEVKPPAGLQLQTPAASQPALQSTGTIAIKRFRFVGSTVVPTEELEAVGAPWTGRPLTADDLRNALAALTAHLRGRGLFAAQAAVLNQAIADGELRVDIVEGHIGKVEIEQPSGARLRPNVAKGYLSSVQPGTLIARGQLDTPLLLLNDLPGVRVEPALTPGNQSGTADLNVKVSDEPLLAGFVRIDNHQVRELGEVEVSGHLRLRNPLGIGDLATIDAVRSHTGGRMRGGASYSAPINYSGTRFGAQFSRQRYRIAGDFEPLQANGDFRRYTLFATHPLVRQNDRNLSAFVSANHVEYRDLIDAFGLATESRHRFVTARLFGDRTDALLGGGVTAFYLEYQAGNVALEPADAAAADAATLGTSGGFSRARIHLERTQRLTARASLYGSWTTQFASQNLALGREFEFTGPDGVRAYAAGELIADEGHLARLEYRHVLVGGASWRSVGALFVDAAHGRINKSPLPGSVVNSRDLWGYGVSLAASYQRNTQAQLVFAWRASQAPQTDPGRNPRVWFVATQYF
jgi:hemolysin activation/secretion protein